MPTIAQGLAKRAMEVKINFKVKLHRKEERYWLDETDTSLNKTRRFKDFLAKFV